MYVLRLGMFIFFAVLASSCSAPAPAPAPTPTETNMPTPEPKSTPLPTSPNSADSAIALVKSQFPQVAQIQRTPPGRIGASQNIFVFERGDGWDVAFWEGWEDCPAGCINNRYSYFSVKRDGRVSKAGEYVRVYNAARNGFDVTGAPMWGVPR